MDKEICNQCGQSVAWGSGRYVNRIPSFWGMGEAPYDSEWMCAECQAIECEECGVKTIEYEIVENAVYCGDCMEKLGLVSEYA